MDKAYALVDRLWLLISVLLAQDEYKEEKSVVDEKSRESLCLLSFVCEHVHELKISWSDLLG